MNAREELLTLLKDKAVKWGKFTLSSGGTSDFYVDGKQITLSPRGAYLVATLILDMLKDEPVEAIGGPTLGADPIVAAVAALSQDTARPLPAFIVRSDQKKHGLQKRIEGILKPGMRVAVVDDVITQGTAVARAIEAVEEAGATVVKVLCLVDREEGGAEALAKYNFTPIFKKSKLK